VPRAIEIITGDKVCIAILYLGSILAGFGQAIIWVAQGEYISNCTTETTKGFYFGYFWAWYMASQIFGNFIGAQIIENTSGPSFFAIMSIIMFIAVLGFCKLQLPLNPAETRIDLLERFST
jgi:hypothetical protein